jgi:hypothetical protein
VVQFEARLVSGHAFTACGKMTQSSNSGSWSNEDSTTCNPRFGQKTAEITMLVHFSAGCEALG